MRAPKRRRPHRRRCAAPSADVNLANVAARVTYVGSSEHKSFPSFAGPPKPRSDASRCDPQLTDPAVLTEWLREAVTAGHVGELWEGDFPRYAWHRYEGVIYEARLVNPGLGQYKGYPLEVGEEPEGLT